MTTPLTAIMAYSINTEMHLLCQWKFVGPFMKTLVKYFSRQLWYRNVHIYFTRSQNWWRVPNNVSLGYLTGLALKKLVVNELGY